MEHIPTLITEKVLAYREIIFFNPVSGSVCKRSEPDCEPSQRDATQDDLIWKGRKQHRSGTTIFAWFLLRIVDATCTPIGNIEAANPFSFFTMPAVIHDDTPTDGSPECSLAGSSQKESPNARHLIR